MTATTAPRASSLRLFGAAAVVVLALGAVFVAGTPGSPFMTVFGDVTQLVLSSGAGVAALVAGRRSVGPLRACWTWIGVGVTGWAVGQLVYCWYELVLEEASPLPSLADLGFLMFPVGVAVGLWKFPNFQPPGIRMRNALDGLVVASSLVVISWWTVLGTVVEKKVDDPLAFAVSLAYPIGDVLFVAMVVYSLTRPGPYRRPLLLLTAALTAMALADSAYAYLSADGDRYQTGSLSDMGWVVAFVLIAVTAIRRPTRLEEAGEESVRVHDAPFIVPFLPVLLAAAVVVVMQVATDQRVGRIDLICFSLAAVGVVGRQYLTYRDNERLLSVVAARVDQLRRQATMDLLTGLTNRALFNDRVGHALELHRRDLRPLAIMFCDLDDFKAVNDTFGHPAGDELLIRVSDRLRGALRTGDTLARFGGDEFAILIEDGGESTAVGARIIEALRPPFTIAGSLLTVRMSVGMIEVKPDDPSPTLEELLANADLAMYSAKRSGKGKLALYDATTMAPNVLDLPLQKPLAAAIAAGEIGAVYQPVVSLSDGMVVGVEALARWHHDGADIPPDQFVPLAARSGLIGGLTTVMLRNACADLARISRQLGHRELRMAVNVPPALITDPGFPARMADVLSRHDIDPAQLVLEITEEALLGDIATVTTVTRALTALGLPLALDDFGKGYSSLVNLQHIPLRILKIDMAFVAGIDRDPRAERLIGALLRLGRDLGLDMVAEGVERPEQAALLRELGCPFAQGHLFAPPAPADRTFALIGRPLDVDLGIH